MTIHVYLLEPFEAIFANLNGAPAHDDIYNMCSILNLKCCRWDQNFTINLVQYGQSPAEKIWLC